MEVQSTPVMQSDFWLKISGVPTELVKSTFVSFYNATPTTAKIQVNGMMADIPVLDRMPDNTKICKSCQNIFNDITDEKKQCPSCGGEVEWRTWKPYLTALGINALMSTYLDFVNPNITTANIKFTERQKKVMSEDQFCRNWAGIIASTFTESLYVHKKLWLTDPEQRLVGPQTSKLWQEIATNVYGALSKGNNAKLMDSSTSSRTISESKMEIQNLKQQEGENPIKNLISRVSDRL